MKKQYRTPDGNAGITGRLGNSIWRRLMIAGALCVWMTANVSWAQATEQQIWPHAGSDQWCWVDPKTDLAPEQVDAVFKKAVAEEMAFLDPGYDATVFFAKHIRLTKGKAKERKKYKGQPAKADNIRIEAEWRNGYLNQYRGQSYCFIALHSVRSLDLHFLFNLKERFPKAPAGRNWNVCLHAGSPYNFFFGTEDTARNFISTVASLLKQRGMELTFSRFGLMWENVTPAQAADLGRPSGESVLVTMVASAGPADRAGIRPLDVILEVNGSRVKNFSHFSLLLDGISSETKASLILLRCLNAPNKYPEQSAWNTLTVTMEAR